MKKLRTLNELKKSKEFDLEMAHSNYEDRKYHLWTSQGYRYNNDDCQHIETFETVKDMLRYVNLVGVAKCENDCTCKSAYF